MSTISSSASAYSPKQNILDYISKQTKSGAISSTDQTALDSALDDIDSALSKDASASTSSTAVLDPKSIKQRIDTLIDKEVSDGKLTSAQADELKSAVQHGGGHGHHHGSATGVSDQSSTPSLASFNLGTDDSSSSDSSSSIFGTDNTSSSSGNATDVLTKFIKQLQSTLNQTTSYTQSGSSQSKSSVTALLINYQA